MSSIMDQSKIKVTNKVQPDDWQNVFTRAVEDNRANVVVIEILDELGDQEMVKGKGLSSMVVQAKHSHPEIELTYEHFAWDKPERLTHFINSPTQVWELQRLDGTTAAFDIKTSSGQQVLVQFETAA